MIPAIALFVLAAETSTAEAEIRASEAHRRHAHLVGDAKALDAILADEFREITGSGAVRTKAQNVADTAAGRIKWNAIDVSEEEVRVFGDAAVYTARAHNKGSFDGKVFDRTIRFTRVYIRRKGHWQCVAAQNTPIDAP